MTGPMWRNPPMSGGFPEQRAFNGENISHVMAELWELFLERNDSDIKRFYCTFMISFQGRGLGLPIHHGGGDEENGT